MAKKNFMNLMKDKTTGLKPSLLSSEENIKSEIIVLDQLVDLIPPLSSDESSQLEQNILTHGIKDPLTIWETTPSIAGIGEGSDPIFILVDGHNRYRLSQAHKLDFRINLVRFSALEEVRDYMINYQLGRRNLSTEQASYLRGLRYLQQKAKRGSNLLAEVPQMNVSETLAKEYGVSSRTIKRDGEFAAGLEKLAPDLKREVLAGKRKIPKSSISAIAKSDTSLKAHSNNSVPDQELLFQEHEGTVQSPERAVDTTKKIIALQTDIRNLANGDLTKRNCNHLLRKINELLNLQVSK